MTDAPAWRFRRMHPGEMNIDPIEAEFFSTEALGSLADALVREAVQNSLDARRDGATVRVRFAFHRAADDADRQRYLAGLSPHLNANRAGLTALPTPDEPLSWVVVEDFGTRGLQGDFRQCEDAAVADDGAMRNDFFFFWRNVGRSRKHASELGRWGLGKTVFQAASRINGFFGCTVRADDARRVLLGQSVLKIHRLDEGRYYPYGYFGAFDGDFALPVEDPVWLDGFCRDFALVRGTEAGLSIVIPYPDPGVTPAAVAESAVRHYFMPMLAGDLVVETVVGDDVTVLDAAALPAAFSAHVGDDAERLLDLARYALDEARTPDWQLPAPPEGAAPRWAALEIDPRELDEQRRRFAADYPVAVRVPVWVKPVDGAPALSFFDLYLKRDHAGNGDQYFVRDGITIAGVRAALPKDLRTLLLVRDAALSQLLGDSENPAHTEWQERSLKFRNRYRHGPFTLRYVKNAPRELLRLLTRPADGRDFRLLTRLFSLDAPERDPTRVDAPTAAGTGNGVEPSPFSEIGVGKAGRFQLSRLQDGFRLSGAADASDENRFAALRAAYDVRRGNPFRQWQPPDFRLDEAPIDVRVTGAAIVRRADNELVVEIGAEEFSVTVTGFDRHRDVRVKLATTSAAP
ncbi:MAG: hypothetical protein AAGD86_04930 [Pseudomonadota bacterium]